MLSQNGKKLRGPFVVAHIFPRTLVCSLHALYKTIILPLKERGINKGSKARVYWPAFAH